MSAVPLIGPQYLQQSPKVWPAVIVVLERTNSGRLRNIGGSPETLSSFPMKETRDEDRRIHGTVCRSHVARNEA